LDYLGVCRTSLLVFGMFCAREIVIISYFIFGVKFRFWIFDDLIFFCRSIHSHEKMGKTVATLKKVSAWHQSLEINLILLCFVMMLCTKHIPDFFCIIHELRANAKFVHRKIWRTNSHLSKKICWANTKSINGDMKCSIIVCGDDKRTDYWTTLVFLDPNDPKLSDGFVR